MAGDTVPISAEKLTRACRLLLEKAGVAPDDAQIIADAVVAGDLRGIESHGVLRLPAYIHRAQSGLLDINVKPKALRDRGAVVLMDAQHGFGQIAGVTAMREAMARAKQYGTGFVAMRNANHFGIAAYYAMMPLAEKMIGIVTTNAAASMAAFGGKTPVLGTNPICVAIPTGGDVDIVLDMASSVVARGKIRLAASKGQPIPQGWALDAEGHPTEDPEAALEGTLLPIAGPKGYGLALVVDVLAGVLTGSDYGTNVSSVHDLTQQSSVGFVMQALDITAFADWDEFQRDITALVSDVLNSPKAEGVNRIFLPGEIEWLKTQEGLKAGIPVPASLLRQLWDLGSELDVDLGFLTAD